MKALQEIIEARERVLKWLATNPQLPKLDSTAYRLLSEEDQKTTQWFKEGDCVIVSLSSIIRTYYRCDRVYPPGKSRPSPWKSVDFWTYSFSNINFETGQLYQSNLSGPYSYDVAIASMRDLNVWVDYATSETIKHYHANIEIMQSKVIAIQQFKQSIQP